MRKLLATFVVLLAFLVGAGAAFSVSRDFISPGAQQGLFFGYTFNFRGLTPGTRYNAYMLAYADDNDPYPYFEGLGTQSVRSDGTIVWQLPPGEFGYYKPEVHKVTGCLTKPSWPYEVIKDQNGNDVCRTISVDDDAY